MTKKGIIIKAKIDRVPKSHMGPNLVQSDSIEICQKESSKDTSQAIEIQRTMMV